MGEDNKSIIKIELPEFIDKALNNVVDKPSRTIGDIISDCLFLVFGKINYKAELKRIEYVNGLKMFSEDLEKKVSAIPCENRVEPKVHTVCTALECMKYCIEEPELRGMFSTLIANSININMANHVHPSFGEIIRQLTPNDAKLIVWLKEHYNVPMIRFKEKMINNNQYFILPFMLIQYSDCDVIKLQLSIENLSRLKLINTIQGEPLAESKLYDDIKQTNNYIILRNSIIENMKEGYVLFDEYGAIELTQFGRRFIEACCE